CGSLYIYYYIYKNSNSSTRACEYVYNRLFLMCPVSIHMCIKCSQPRNIMHNINMSILYIVELLVNFLDIFLYKCITFDHFCYFIVSMNNSSMIPPAKFLPYFWK